MLSMHFGGALSDEQHPAMALLESPLGNGAEYYSLARCQLGIGRMTRIATWRRNQDRSRAPRTARARPSGRYGFSMNDACGSATPSRLVVSAG